MNHHYDLLSITAFFSGLVHAVFILGVGFSPSDVINPNNIEHTLDIALIKKPNNDKPLEAKTIATHDNAGGGVHDHDASSSPVLLETIISSPIESIKMITRHHNVNTTTPNKLINRHNSEIKVIAEPLEESHPKLIKSTVGTNVLTTEALRQLEKERLIAKLNKSIEDYHKRPKKEFLSPTTKQHEAAEYLERWRRKVVATGNANYPVQAIKQSLHGSLILTVEIKRDGSLHAIHINRPSAHKILDDAAVWFVRDAAPFGVFPENINKNTDILVVTRSFKFLKNNRLIDSDDIASSNDF